MIPKDHFHPWIKVYFHSMVKDCFTWIHGPTWKQATWQNVTNYRSHFTWQVGTPYRSSGWTYLSVRGIDRSPPCGVLSWLAPHRLGHASHVIVYHNRPSTAVAKSVNPRVERHGAHGSLTWHPSPSSINRGCLHPWEEAPKDPKEPQDHKILRIHK